MPPRKLGNTPPTLAPAPAEIATPAGCRTANVDIGEK
jgi:hypothetical protein